MSKSSFMNDLTIWLFRKEYSPYFWKIREKAIKGNFISRYFHKFKYRKLMSKFNCFIPLNTHFENKPSFPHGVTGIFVSASARIGKDCVIFQQVTIGSNTLKESGGRGAPILGDNVYIGSGAKIIGNVRIGNNVRIGANCVVVKDVPDNCTVVLEQPRVIYHKEPRDNSFVNIEDFK